MNLADLREQYTKGGLKVSDLDLDPIVQLKEWLEIAFEAGIQDANAMTLSTSNGMGRVTSRVVLLKGLEDSKLRFFTNYNSRKAQDLEENPNAAMNLHWRELERQICIRGEVAKTSREVSEEYFASRPYESQIGAWASENQSEQVGVRALLESRKERAMERFPEGQPVPCPDYWGGYQLTPRYIEFWQGRVGRLHDRISYRDTNQVWTQERLNP